MEFFEWYSALQGILDMLPINSDTFEDAAQIVYTRFFVSLGIGLFLFAVCTFFYGYGLMRMAK